MSRTSAIASHYWQETVKSETCLGAVAERSNIKLYHHCQRKLCTPWRIHWIKNLKIMRIF